jgi:protein-tyrosine phosphatase
MDWFSQRPENESRPSRGSGRPGVSEILDQLVIGEYPRPQDAEWLKLTHRITAVHNLQDDVDLRLHGIDLAALKGEYAGHGIAFVHTPIADTGDDAVRERLDTALADLHRLIESGKRVYLHCNAGMNRAPTVAIAYLHAHHRMPLEEAMAHVKSRRPCGPFMAMLEEHFGPPGHKHRRHRKAKGLDH